MSLKHMLMSATVALGLIGGATAGLAQEYSFDMPNVFSEKSSDGAADVLFGKLVAEKTQGRVKITHPFDGSLGYKGVDHLDAVQDGGVPMARHALSYYGGHDPLFLLSSLPFLMQDVDDLNALYSVYEERLAEQFLEYNQVLLSAGIFPPSGIWSRQPITQLSELQGVKIRAFDLSSLETFLGAGAAAINMNWGDVMPALSGGAIDAVVTSADLGVNSGLNDYLPAFTEINWAVPISTITINKDVWDGLPEDIQAAMLEAGAEATRATFERLPVQVGQNYDDMRAKGVTVIDKPNPDLRAKLVEAAAPFIAQWRESAGEDAAILDAYKAARQK